MGWGYFKACFLLVTRGDNIAVTGVTRGRGFKGGLTKAGRIGGSTFVGLGAAVEEGRNM